MYDYQCDSCEQVQEINVSMKQRDQLTEIRKFCKCGGNLYRKISYNGSVYAPTSGKVR